MHFGVRILCIVGCIAVALALKPHKSLQGYEDAVFAGLSSSIRRRESPLKFNYVGTDVRGSYDQKGGKFYPIDGGDYWVALSAGAIPGQRYYSVGYRLYVEGERICSIRRNDNSYTGNDTMSRDIIVPVKAYESMYMETRYTLFSDQGIQTSFGAFRLTDLLRNESVYFSAVLETDTYGRDFTEGETVTFNRTLVNHGNAFDITTGIFTVPRSGLYFLSLSIGTTTSLAIDNTYDFSIRRRATVLGTLEKYATVANDADIVSRAGLYELVKGDVITIRSDKENYAVVSFAQDLQTSFSGFEFGPVYYKPIIGFSVARTSGWKGSTALDPIPFDTILVNYGGYWDKTLNIFIVPVTGVYYLTVTAGAEPAETLDINILVNGEEEASLLSTSVDRNGKEVLSRSAILHLYAKSILSLRAEKRTAFYSNSELQTSFSGLMLFPINPK